MFVSFLAFSLSGKSLAMCWWLWTSLNTCPWRTCASSVGPSSTRSDTLWPFSLTTGRMETLGSGNLAWGTWQVSETCKCGGFVARRKKRVCWVFPCCPGSCVSSEGFVGTSFFFLVHQTTSLHKDQKLYVRVMARAYLKQKTVVWRVCELFFSVCWYHEHVGFLVIIPLIIARVASGAGYFLPSCLSFS